MAISEALVAVLSFLEEQHPFVPAWIQHFPSSPIFSLSYVRDFQLSALAQNGHNCLECFLFFLWICCLIFWGHLWRGYVSICSSTALCASQQGSGEMFGRVLHPARLLWQLDATRNSKGASVCSAVQSPACCWAAMHAVAAQQVPQWQIKFSIPGLSTDIKIKIIKKKEQI